MKIRLRKSKNVKKVYKFKEFRDFFWAPNTLCLTLGIDVHQTLSTKWKPLLYLVTFCEITMHIYTRYNLLHGLYSTIIERDTQQFSNVALFFMYATDSNIKLSSLFLHRQLLRKVYNTLEASYPSKSEELELYRVNEHHATSAKPVIVFYNYIACWLIMLGPLLESLLTYAYDWMVLPAEKLQFSYLKPIPVVYPFDYTLSMGYYLLAYLIEWINGVFTIHSLLASDMTLLCLIAQINMHFEYIARSLENYEPRPKSEDKDCKFLTDVIQKHQQMLSLYKDLNVIFGLSLATNLFTTSCILCFVAVQLTMLEFGIYFFKYCLFQITVIGNFYMVCSYGQQLTTSSTDIAVSAYKSQWYRGSTAYKKLLLILIMRSQKQAELSAKGYQKISLDIFKSVMIMSYRVFAVLRSALQ